MEHVQSKEPINCVIIESIHIHSPHSLLAASLLSFLKPLLREPIFAELPEVLVELLEVISFEPIEAAELEQDILEPAVLLQVVLCEIREAVNVPEVLQHLVDIAVPYRIV